MSKHWYKELGQGITLLDVELGEHNFAASYLMEEKGKAGLVEVGNSHSTPIILDILKEKGIACEDVSYVMVTHVHLDHAGGAGSLMRHLPNAKLVVHPRGAKHMIDPCKLIAGARAVYGGEENLKKAFGEILPTPAERIVEAPDGFSLDLNGRKLVFLDTPGHALHHYCIWDEKSKGVFTGDTFGISFGEFKTQDGILIFPSTSPVQADVPAAHASIDRIMSLSPDYVYLTHFGKFGDVPKIGRELHVLLDEYKELAHRAMSEKNKAAFIEAGFQEIFWRRIGPYCHIERAKVFEFLKIDLELNAQGLAIWAEKFWKSS